MRPVDGPVPTGPGWIAQPKLDGWRGVVDATGTTVTVRSRNRTDLTERFPQLQQLTGSGLILDGELVVYGPDGRPDFHQVAATRPAGRFAYVAFDLLATADGCTCPQPLHQRLDQLAGLDLPDVVQVAPTGPPHVLWDAVTSQGLEGIVSKHLDSPYRPGRRHRDWRRTKNWTTTRMRLHGYTPAGNPDDPYAENLHVGPADTVVAVVELGIPRQLAVGLPRLVAPLEHQRTRRTVRLHAGVTVTVRHHGPPERPRDIHFIGIDPPR